MDKNKKILLTAVFNLDEINKSEARAREYSDKLQLAELNIINLTEENTKLKDNVKPHSRRVENIEMKRNEQLNTALADSGELSLLFTFF